MLQHVFLLFILNLLQLESSASKQRIIGGKNKPPRKIWQPLQQNYCFFIQLSNYFCRFSTLHCVHPEQKWVKSQNDMLLFLAQTYFCMNFRHTCGGSIIGNSTFITAAHCFYDHSKRQIPSNKFLIVSGKYKQIFFNE